MPLRKLINRSMLSPEDADLLESLFNQFSSKHESDEDRLARASGLVQMFAKGERDREKLIDYLVSTGPYESAHSISGTPPL